MNPHRMTFDSAADLYQQARPEYPEQLYGTLIDAAGLTSGDELLEVGCATGKATLPLARRGFRITCVEIGPDLAGVARRNLAAFPDVTVIETAFETWRPAVTDRYELVFAATSWHWLDPVVRYQRAWEALGSGGHLAFWSATHVFPDGGDRFFFEIQDVYDEIGEGKPLGEGWPRPGELADSRVEIERSGLFTDVIIRHFDWETIYNAEEYLRLLDTFSGHIAMPTAKRNYLYAEIKRRLSQRPDGRLRRHWGAVLHVARRIDAPEEPPSPA
jgi:SAM-dependent methyltransferase